MSEKLSNNNGQLQFPNSFAHRWVHKTKENCNFVLMLVSVRLMFFRRRQAKGSAPYPCLPGSVELFRFEFCFVWLNENKWTSVVNENKRKTRISDHLWISVGTKSKDNCDFRVLLHLSDYQKQGKTSVSDAFWNSTGTINKEKLQFPFHFKLQWVPKTRGNYNFQLMLDLTWLSRFKKQRKTGKHC